MELIETIFAAIGLLVTGATLVVQGLKLLAGITPSTKDDEFVSGIERALGYIAALLERFSLTKAK